MRGRRVALALTLLVILGQLAHRSPLTDVVRNAPAADVRLAYPLFHVLLAPFTLSADWLNGGSTRDLLGFLLWSLLVFMLVRLGVGEGRWVVGCGLWVVGAAAFLGAVAYAPRPVPRLVSGGGDQLVFDIHSHSALSHDGRKWFAAHQNALWHARAGFDVAFLTDHNRCCGAKAWRVDRAGQPPRLLDGEELSLHGLHVVALGLREEVSNRGYNDSWDSTLAMVRYLAADSVFAVASLPEFWRNHWGEDLGRLVEAGIAGFEVWTSSPRAMDFPAARRRELLAQVRRLGLVPLGATDMHGLGRTASVWNVTRLEGWRLMDDSTLASALLGSLRQSGAESNRVIAMARWIPESRLGAAIALPANAWLILRTASRPHGLVLVAWLWLPLLLNRLKKRKG